MNVIEEKKRLVEKGNFILGKVQQSTLGLGTIIYVLDDVYVKELQEWFFDVEEFIERCGLDCHKDRFKAIGEPLLRNRVNKERLCEILAIINRIKD